MLKRDQQSIVLNLQNQNKEPLKLEIARGPKNNNEKGNKN